MPSRVWKAAMGVRRQSRMEWFRGRAPSSRTLPLRRTGEDQRHRSADTQKISLAQTSGPRLTWLQDEASAPGSAHHEWGHQALPIADLRSS
jgi:hypothetical protein